MAFLGRDKNGPMYKSLLVLVLGACARASKCPIQAMSTTRRRSRPLRHSATLHRFQKLLHGLVANGGFWSNDPECMKQFPVAERIEKDRIHAFAACLAGLKLQRSNRKDMLLDVAVLTYARGFRSRPNLRRRPRARLSWIGYESRRDVADGNFVDYRAPQRCGSRVNLTVRSTRRLRQRSSSIASPNAESHSRG